MWFRRRRRRARLDLSALDRLSELIERIVVLLPDGDDAPAPPAAEPVAAPSAEPPPPEVAPAFAAPAPFLVLVPSAAGYELAEAEGSTPARGELVELPAGRFRVLRLGPSPLPGDARRCAFVEREEPPPPGRTPDG